MSLGCTEYPVIEIARSPAKPAARFVPTVVRKFRNREQMLRRLKLFITYVEYKESCRISSTGIRSLRIYVRPDILQNQYPVHP